MAEPLSAPATARAWATCAFVFVVGVALPLRAAETTGRIFGQVSDEASGAPLAGLTIVARGPQGEDAVLTEEDGSFAFAALPVGSYTLLVYAAGAAPVERPGVVVSADKAVRVNLRLPRQETRTETYVIERRVPLVDLGTARAGVTQSREDLLNLPSGTSYGEVLTRTPGAFTDRAGNVSIAGASGLENTYLVDGLNVTGIEYGDILGRRPNSTGGSNLPLAFVEELSISTGGYAAEYGGAMGGVINVVTKSGSNRHHGSASLRLLPGFLAADAEAVRRADSVLVGRHSQGTGWELGLEVGGPIIRDRLFYWVGFVPRRQGGAFVRDIYARSDGNGDGMDDRDDRGALLTTTVGHSESDEQSASYPFAGKVTFLPGPEQRLNLGLFVTPSRTVMAYDRTGGDGEAAAHPSWALQRIAKDNTDVVADWTGHFLERRWRLEARLGLHHERLREGSPNRALEAINQSEWHGASLADLEGIEACRPVMRGGALWDPCPVEVYRNGGYGHVRRYSAQRWIAELKSTNVLSALGAHELKYGARFELAALDQTRFFSGPAGSRGLVQHFPGNTSVWSFFSLPKGRYPFQFGDRAPGSLDPNLDGSPEELGRAPIYRDELVARVKSMTPALFLQDSYSPLPNLTALGGVRFESQRLYDHAGERFATLDNLSFRGGLVYDFTNEGRSKAFAHYGRFYESVPLNLAVRYFGGEGILVRNYDNTRCPAPPPTWTGQGEWQGCPLQPEGPGGSAYAIFNNGSNYPVQPHLRGQHHDEIVGGFHYELAEGWLLGLEYTRRWLGAVIEDGTTSDFTFVLANPGQIPAEALRAAEADVEARQSAVDAAAPADRGAREAELGAARSRLANLKGLAEAPRPERTYNAITLSTSKRLGRRLAVNAWYTYSRLWGNYNGLYDADNNYAAPNGNNAYDTPELVLNKRGPLANDRPHAARIAAHYEQPLGSRGALLAGLFFSAYSGVPRNHVSALIPGQQLVFLLPRGSAGRTPAVTQVDLRLAYRLGVSKLVTMELSVELFNLLNRRTPLRQDDNYTHDMAAPIVGGDPRDLPHAKNIAGAPVRVNENFGQGTAYQPPFHGQVGLRAFF